MGTGGRITLPDSLCSALTEEAAFWAANSSGGSYGSRFRTMLTELTGATLIIANGERQSGDDLVYNLMVKHGFQE
jgi:hypothetical protein